MRKLFALIAITVLAAFGVAACGGDGGGDDTAATTTEETTQAGGGTGGGGTGGGGGETVSLEADPSGALAYQQDKLTANAGTVTIDFKNPASLAHDVCLEDGGDLGCSDTISGGETQLTVDLQPGDYTYFCSVDGHREAGMEGTLTAK